ncbi:MAG: dockerin type I domain-containing protein [Faecousia sp.]
MKKPGSFFLIAALVLSLALTAAAAETGSCTVSADSVSAAAGSTVTVPVRITGNPGFTNFAIALDYDREQLELISINVSDGENAYLCGSLASVNTEWADEDGQTCGYIVCANPEKVTDDGILFTAAFQVSETFSGTTEVTPITQYIRNEDSDFILFEDLLVSDISGAVTGILRGDLNGDGDITARDASLIYNILKSEEEITDDLLAVADVNNDGEISARDAQKVYNYANGKISSLS